MDRQLTLAVLLEDDVVIQVNHCVHCVMFTELENGHFGTWAFQDSSRVVID